MSCNHTAHTKSSMKHSWHNSHYIPFKTLGNLKPAAMHYLPVNGVT